MALEWDPHSLLGSNPSSPTAGCVTLAQPLNLSESELPFL